MLHLGTRKGLFSFECSDGRWHPVRSSFLGVQVPMVLPDRRDGSLYAAVEHGHFGSKLHRSTDAGLTWEELPPPAYPPKPEDAPIVRDAFRNIEIPWSLEKIWCLESGGTDEPGVLWCGTIPGGLFRSPDHGATWELNRPLWDRPERAKWAGGGYDFAGIHSIVVDPRDSRHVMAAVSCGGVWRTRDGGRSWAQTATGMRAAYLPPEQAFEPDGQDPHRLVACPGAPDRMWVQHHNGIFSSVDGGTSWQENDRRGPSTFGFAVAVHPRDPDRVWFVPATADECRIPEDGRLIVSRSRDGCRTFETLTNGLPQAGAYHLVYRHGLDISPDGRTLAMGSTTGSAWVSDDQGEQWQRLSCDLPPIFCTRFD